MKLRIQLLLIIIATCWACQPKTENKPEQVDFKEKMSNQLVQAVLWYQIAAEMQLCYMQAYQYGKLLLDKKLAEHKGGKPSAVVLDLDETVLDNSPYEGMLIKTNSTYTDESWNEWVALAEAKILPGAADFIKYASDQGVEVFYISNRTRQMIAPTINNLEALGLPNADSTHVLLKEETSDKTERRDKVWEEYDILVFVGDNLTDFSELYADRDSHLGRDLVKKHQEELLNSFVMLPNPMYGEWEKAIYGNDYSIGDSAMLRLRANTIKAY